MIALLFVGAALAGGLGRRIAGGVLAQWIGEDCGTQLQRAIWATTAALTAWAAGAPWWASVLIAVAVWSSSCVFGFSFPWESVHTGLLCGRAVGTTHPWASTKQWLHDQACLLWHGLGGTAAVAVVAWAAGGVWWFPVIAGALCGPTYELAYRFPLGWPAVGCLRRDPPPTAELVWGALVGVSIAAAFTLFRPA